MHKGLTPDTLLKEGQNYAIAWAIQDLSKALTERRALYSMNSVTQAIRHLNEFLGEVSPVPTLTETEANVARALHTYMRKYMDGPLSGILYRLIADNRGLPIWYGFIKGLVAEKGNFREAMEHADKVNRDGHDTTDDLLMESALRLWKDDFIKNGVWKYINGK